MILFHGSNIAVSQIDFTQCRPYRDFGKGFYTTIYPDQAKRMAERVVRLYGGKPIVSLFDYDEDASKKLKIRLFEKPSKEWALFVMNNRMRDFIDTQSPESNADAKYDIVIGPVANDDMALLFRQYSEGLISIEAFTQKMEFSAPTNQYSFHTERAAATLRFKECIE
jgi:hypothetical protein